MKKVLAIAVLLVIVTAGVAMASATNWLIYVKVSDPGDMNAGVYNQVGVKPLATDGVDSYDVAAYYLASTIKTASQKIGAITTTAYDKNFLSTAAYTTYPSSKKIWSFRVAGLSAAETNTGSTPGIKLFFQTAQSTVVQNPAAVPGTWGYYIKLVNARGQTILRPSWAPNPGAAWTQYDPLNPWASVIKLDVPTAINGFFGQVDLPTIKLSVDDNAHMLSEGYEFEFIQGPPIPEPSSLLVLGTGLAGLLGFVSRRRKA